MNLNENGSRTGAAGAPAAGGPDRRPRFGGEDEPDAVLWAGPAGRAAAVGRRTRGRI